MPWSMEQKIFCVKTYYETKSFQIVQARFRRKFSFNNIPNRSQIFKLVKKFETHGSCGDRRVTGSSPSGPPTTIRTPDNVTRVQESVGWSLISRKAEVEWAPHSPDLNPPDFFLWGFLKDNIYHDNPLTIAALKAAIAEKIQAIKQEDCGRVINNFFTPHSRMPSTERWTSGACTLGLFLTYYF